MQSYNLKNKNPRDSSVSRGFYFLKQLQTLFQIRAQWFENV